MATPVPISAAVTSGRARAKKEGRPRGAARAGGREAKPMAAGWTERLCGAVTYVTAFPPGRPPEDGARRRATGVALAMPASSARRDVVRWASTLGTGPPCRIDGEGRSTTDCLSPPARGQGRAKLGGVSAARPQGVGGGAGGL